MATQTPFKILGIDPGKTSGVAVVEIPTGNVLFMANLSESEMMDFLNNEVNEDFKHFIIENFLVYRHKAGKLTGSKMEAPKVIGMIEITSRRYNIPITKQMANVLDQAQKITGLVPRGSHGKNHWVDALNHALLWAYSRRLLKTPLQEELGRKRNAQ